MVDVFVCFRGSQYRSVEASSVYSAGRELQKGAGLAMS